MPDEPLLVAYNFRFDLEQLLKHFPEAVVLDKKGECISDWNNGKIKMLLAHPQSAGHGLNLQKGGSIIVWYGLTWNLGNYLQFNARLYRQGQSKRVRIIHLVVEGGMDEQVVNAINAKATTQAELIEFLKISEDDF